MCTVTVLPERLLTAKAARGDLPFLRVACNRDELLSRAAALPPVTWMAGARCAVMPIDPESGGTWIAANDAGLVFVILNVNAGGLIPAAEASRGSIIPTLVGGSTLSEALDRVRELRAERYRPFRLLLIDRYHLVECWPDQEGRVKYRRAFVQGAVMRTSSGLGDAIVVGPRRTLFRQLFLDPLDHQTAQETFHRHQWPGREDVSVRMQRDDARTVSQTVVEVREHSVSLAYHPIDSPDSVSVYLAASSFPSPRRRETAEAVS